MSSQDLFKQAEHEQEQMARARQDLQDIRTRAQDEERAAQQRFNDHQREHDRLMRDAETDLKREQEAAQQAANDNSAHPIKDAIKRGLF